jgi:hypothetical protein
VRWLFATFFQKGARFIPVFFLPVFFFAGALLKKKLYDH